MDQEPKIIPSSQEQAPKILSFEEFSFRNKYNHPRYNSFFLYFSGKTHRIKKDCYLKFVSENETLAKLLCDKIQELLNKPVSRPESFKTVDRELYEAYKIMRGYGVSNNDLFR